MSYTKKIPYGLNFSWRENGPEDDVGDYLSDLR